MPFVTVERENSSFYVGISVSAHAALRCVTACLEDFHRAPGPGWHTAQQTGEPAAERIAERAGRLTLAATV